MGPASTASGAGSFAAEQKATGAEDCLCRTSCGMCLACVLRLLLVWLACLRYIVKPLVSRLQSESTRHPKPVPYHTLARPCARRANPSEGDPLPPASGFSLLPPAAACRALAPGSLPLSEGTGGRARRSPSVRAQIQARFTFRLRLRFRLRFMLRLRLRLRLRLLGWEAQIQAGLPRASPNTADPRGVAQAGASPHS